MLSVFERFLRQLIVRPDRSYNGNDVDVLGSEDLVLVGCETDGGKDLLEALFAFRIAVRHQNDFTIVLGVKIPNDVRTPVSVTNHTDTHGKTPWDFSSAAQSGGLRRYRERLRGKLLLEDGALSVLSFEWQVPASPVTRND